MAHALTTYPTHPKFGTVITNKLSQKTTPQVRRPVAVVIPVRVNKIHVRNTPKASETADLNCLNFKLAVPPPKQEHTQNSWPTRSSQPPTLFFQEEQDPKPVEIKM